MLSTCISCRLRLLGTVLLSVLCQNCLSYIPHTRLGTQSYAPTVPRSELIQSTKVAEAIDRKSFGRCQKIRTKSALTGRSRGFAGLSATTRASYVSPIQEAVGSLLGTDSSQDHQPSALIDAAASLTQESCRLLGTKSLGVDYGLARTGIAVTVGFEPKPLDIVQSNLTSEVCEQVVRHAEREQANCVVVGLPLHKNGSVAEQTEITLEFCQALAAMVLSELGPDVPVFVWDERYTSKEAAARAHSRDPGRLLYGTLDAEAACIILEHFYVDNGVGAFPIVVTDDEVRRQCLESYEIRRRSEEMRKVGMMKERERKLQRRKDSIARARELEEQQRTVGCSIPIDKRKKRKKKR